MEDPSSRFTTIYNKKRWGIGSGDGSDPIYCAALISYLENLLLECDVKSVLDLGCGDGRVAGAVNWYGARYHGVDCAAGAAVVGGTYERADFLANGALAKIFAAVGPTDLVLVKDVLQHLTDTEILSFTSVMNKMPWRILLLVNDWRYVRSPQKNGAPRSVENPYSWAPIPYGHTTLVALGGEVVLYYPRNRRKQVIRIDKSI